MIRLPRRLQHLPSLSMPLCVCVCVFVSAFDLLHSSHRWYLSGRHTKDRAVRPHPTKSTPRWITDVFLKIRSTLTSQLEGSVSFQFLNWMERASFFEIAMRDDDDEASRDGRKQVTAVSEDLVDAASSLRLSFSFQETKERERQRERLKAVSHHSIITLSP